MMYEVKNNESGTIKMYSAKRLFNAFKGHALFPEKVANHEGETYNPYALQMSCLKGKDRFSPALKYDGDLPLRPLIITDEAGHRMTEKEIREFVTSYTDETPDTPVTDYEAVAGYRSEPVSGTGRNRRNELDCEYRSGCYFDEDYDLYLVKKRSRRNDRSWKKDFRCRKAWGKHTGIDPRKTLKYQEKRASAKEEEDFLDIVLFEDELKRQEAMMCYESLKTEQINQVDAA